MWLTKEIVKNYFFAFNTLFVRWVMFRGEPVIAALWHQVVNHLLINQCTPRLEITFPSLDEGITGIRALLDNPKNVRDRREWLRIVVRSQYKRKGRISQTDETKQRRCLCNWKYMSEGNGKGWDMFLHGIECSQRREYFSPVKCRPLNKTDKRSRWDKTCTN